MERVLLQKKWKIIQIWNNNWKIAPIQDWCFPWLAEVAPFITDGGLEGKYLLHTTQTHWGTGASLLCLGIEHCEGLNYWSEHQIETTQYGGEVLSLQGEVWDPQEASKHRVVKQKQNSR